MKMKKKLYATCDSTKRLSYWEQDLFVIDLLFQIHTKNGEFFWDRDIGLFSEPFFPS